MKLSIADAQKLALHHQGLLRKSSFGLGKAGAYRAINHLGYVQIDAISVVQRAHHQTLWSRVKNYRPEHLDCLLSVERKVFEYWSHAASFLPMSDYRFYLPRMQELAESKKHWYVIDKKIKQYVYDRISREGPLFARDFESDYKRSGEMWDFKPAKRALHELFMEGRLMVSARHNFQRLYDLPERVLPPDVSLVHPSKEELAKFIIQKTLHAHGLASINEMTYQRNGLKTMVQTMLNKMEQAHEIIKVKLEYLPGKVFYSTNQNLESIPSRVVKQIHFLSPFDNAVIQRKRIQQLFNFKYQTEIYLPPAKRIYGYFSLPILWGTRFIGRMDPKADRKNKVLMIRNLHLEPGVKVIDRLLTALKSTLNEFAIFNGCEHVRVEQTNMPAF